jgi:hypothetical protein
MPENQPDREQSLRYWQTLRELTQQIRADRSVEEDFLRSPGNILRERGLDILIPDDQDPDAPGHSFAQMLDNMSAAERQATLQALEVAAGERFDPGRVAIAVPIANVNVAANHNVAANSSSAANAVAVSNALAVQNTAGATLSGLDLVRPGITATVNLAADAIEPAVEQRFQELQLNEARQKALLKRTLLDSDSIIRSEIDAEGLDVRSVRYVYRGNVLEIEGRVGPETIDVTSVKLIE